MNSRLHHRLRHHGHCTRADPPESQSQSQTPPEEPEEPPLLFVLPTCHPQPPAPEQPVSRSRFPSLDLPYPQNVPLPNQWQRPSLPLAFIPSSRWSAPVEQVALLCSEWSALVQPDPSAEQPPPTPVQLALSQWRHSLQQAPTEQSVFACAALPQTSPTTNQPFSQQVPLEQTVTQWNPSVEQAPNGTQWPLPAEHLQDPNSQWRPPNFPENENRPSTTEAQPKPSLSESPWRPSLEKASLSSSQWRPSVHQALLQQIALHDSQWRPSVEQAPLEQDSQWRPTVEEAPLEQTAQPSCTQKDQLPGTLALLRVPQSYISTFRISTSPTTERPPLVIFPPRQTSPSKIRWADGGEDFSELEGQRNPASSGLSSSVSSVSCECSRETSVDGYSDISRTGGGNVNEVFVQDISGKYRPCPSCRLGNTCGSQSGLLQSSSVPCIPERCPSEHLSSSQSSCNVPVELLLRRGSPRRAEPLALLVRINENISDPCGKESPPTPPPKTELKPSEEVQQVPPPKTEPEAKKRRPKRASDCRNALHFIYVMLHASAIAFRVWDYTASSEQGKPLTIAMPAASNEKSPAICQENPPPTTEGTSLLGSTEDAQWFERMRARLPDGWVPVRVPDDQREEEFLRRFFLNRDEHKKHSHRRRTTIPASSGIVKKKSHRSHKKHHHKHLGNSTNGSIAPLHTSLEPKTRNPLWQDEEFVQRLKDHLETLQQRSKEEHSIEVTTTEVRNKTLKPVDENIILLEEAQLPEPRTVTIGFPLHPVVPNKTKKKVPTKEKPTPVGNRSPSKHNPKRPEPYGNVLSKPKFYHKSFVPKDRIIPGGDNDTIHTIRDLSEKRPLPKRNNMVGVVKRDSSIIPESLIEDAKNEEDVTEKSSKTEEPTTEAQEKSEASTHFLTILLDLLVFTQTGSASVFLLSLHAALAGYVVCIAPFLIFNVLWCLPVAVVLLVYSVKSFLSLAIILFLLAALQICEIGCLLRRKMERSRKRGSHHNEKD